MIYPADPVPLGDPHLLVRAMRALGASLDPAEVARTAVRVSAAACGAEACVLRLVDPTGGLGVAARSAELTPAEGLAEEALARHLHEAAGAGACSRGACGETPAAAGVPIAGDATLRGTLVALRGSAFEPAETALLSALAEEIGRRLAQARRFQAAEQRATELATLREIGQAIVTRLDLAAVLEAVVAGTLRLLDAQHAQIVLCDPGTGVLRFGAAVGPEAERVRHQQFELGRGVNGVVAATRRAMIVNDYRSSPYALAEFRDVVATITAPVCFGDRLLGVLHSHRTEAGRAYTGDDLRLIQLLATHAAIAIENARLFEESQRHAEAHLRKLRQISILQEIGTAMQGTMHLDALLRVILTGATFGGGLGFNRAMLLLVDESERTLRGRLGVGPDTSEEAARIWGALATETRPLREVIADRATRHAGEGPESEFARLARGLEIPLDPPESLLARTVLEALPLRVRGAGAQPAVRPEWEGRLDVDEFAAVPLAAQGRVIGVLVVDNKFTGKAISDDDMELLSVFASQAGLAAEHAQVYTRLEEAHREIQRSHLQLVQQERLAALGEMAAHMVHEIRNPLVAIGGFARRLVQRLAEREAEGAYARVIAGEVERLERIVQDVGGLSRDIRFHPTEVDLHALVQDCIVLVGERLAQQSVALRRDLAMQAPLVAVDAVRIKQALLNLMANALDAMPMGGTLMLATRIEVEHPDAPDPSASAASRRDRGPRRLGPGEWAVVSVGDSGGGVAPERVEKLFEPFFTTKDAGTGLGLTVVRRVAHLHGGRVVVDNRPGAGVTFHLWLPASVAAAR